MEEIASVYARSLFEVAQEQGKLDDVREQLGEFADALDSDQHRPLHAEMRERPFQGAAHGLRDEAAQGPGRRLYDRHGDARVRQIVRELAADEAGPHHGDPPPRAHGRPERGVVAQIVDGQDPIGRRARDRDVDRIGPQRQNQAPVGDGLTVNPLTVDPLTIDPKRLPVGLDRRDPRTGPDRGLELRRHGGGIRQGDRVRGLAAGVGVRQDRLRVVAPVIGGEDQDGCLRVELAKLAGQGIAPEPRPHDDDRPTVHARG